MGRYAAFQPVLQVIDPTKAEIGARSEPREERTKCRHFIVFEIFVMEAE